MESLRNVQAQTNALKDQYFPGFNKKIANLAVVGKYIDTTSRQLGASNIVFVACLAVVAAVFATWGLGTDTLCNIGGFVFPALQTLRARTKEDMEQWISYWLIFTTLNVVQGSTYVFDWIPFFDGLKLGFLLFCSLPTTRGAEFIFHTFFKHHVRGTKDGDTTVKS